MKSRGNKPTEPIRPPTEPIRPRPPYMPPVDVLPRPPRDPPSNPPYIPPDAGVTPGLPGIKPNPPTVSPSDPSPRPPDDPPSDPSPRPPDDPPSDPSPRPPDDPPSDPSPPINPPNEDNKKNKINENNSQKKELKKMKSSNVISVFSKEANKIKVHKDQLKFPLETTLPALCFLNDEKMVGVATDFYSFANEYVVDMDKNKIYAYTLFDDSDVPDKVGADLYITADGKLTKTKGSNKKIGIFIEKRVNAILFKID